MRAPVETAGRRYASSEAVLGIPLRIEPARSCSVRKLPASGKRDLAELPSANHGKMTGRYSEPVSRMFFL